VLNAAKFSLNEESFARFLKIVGSNIAQISAKYRANLQFPLEKSGYILVTFSKTIKKGYRFLSVTL
jgi:hypothetical protein